MKLHTMKFIFEKEFCFLFSLIFCVLLLSGCTTASLWHYDKITVVSDNNSAKVDQIYAAVDKNIVPNSSDYVNIVRYAILYHLQESDQPRSNKILFPKKPHGYLIISDEIINYFKGNHVYEASSYYGEQYQDTFKYRERFESTRGFIKELNANRLYIIKASGRASYYFDELTKLNFRFKNSTNTKPAFGYLRPIDDSIPPGAWSGLTTYQRVLDDNQRGYYELCCLKGTVTYADKIDLSEFTPILPEEFGPLEANFYLLRGEKKYTYPLYARLIDTPITVALDVISFPLQLIYFSILPHGPGWPWEVE